jgi:hypothetical protein
LKSSKNWSRSRPRLGPRPPPPTWAAWWPAPRTPPYPAAGFPCPPPTCARQVSVMAAWEANRVRWETKERERALQEDRDRTKAVRRAFGAMEKRRGGPRSVPGGSGLLAGHRHPSGPQIKGGGFVSKTANRIAGAGAPLRIQKWNPSSPPQALENRSSISVKSGLRAG